MHEITSSVPFPRPPLLVRPSAEETAALWKVISGAAFGPVTPHTCALWLQVSWGTGSERQLWQVHLGWSA